MNTLQRVEKIGWDDSFRLSDTSNMIRERIKKWEKWIYFFSALKDSSEQTKFNTTSTLIDIGKACWSNDKETAIELFSKLEEFHLKTIQKEFSWDEILFQRITSECQSVFKYYKQILIAYFDSNNSQTPTEENDYIITVWDESFSLLWLWEIIASKLYVVILNDDGAKFLDTTNVITKNPNNAVIEAASNIKTKVVDILEQEDTWVIIAPWYTWIFPNWIIKTWDRWYSDATAANVYMALKDSCDYDNLELAIKKLFVICSADPRIVGIDNVRVIRALSLRLLLEMIWVRWAAWPFVNINAVSPTLLKNDGTIRLYSQEDNEGSLITIKWDPESKWVLFVQSKPVIAINIESFYMNKKWYIEKIGEYFKKHEFAIDNLVSSGTAITITLGERKNMSHSELKTFIAWLKAELSVFEDDKDTESTLNIAYEKLSEIYIWWENFDHPWLIKTISTVLSDAGINIATSKQPMNPRVVIIWVDRNKQNEAVRLLHKELIESK